jgi:hypothetical protein
VIGRYVQVRANQFGCNMTKVLYTIVDHNVFKVTCFLNIMKKKKDFRGNDPHFEGLFFFTFILG